MAMKSSYTTRWDTIGEPMQPGDPMLAYAYAEVKSDRHYIPTDDLEMIVREFRRSAEFSLLRPETRLNYLHYFDDIRFRFGALSLAELQQPTQRGEFKRWRDSMSDRPRTADYAWTTLARVLSFAKDRGFIATNVCERGGRLYAADRADKIWTDDDIAAFRKVASNELAFALDLALWTGQPQRDLLQLKWTQYDGRTLKIRQSKTGARVVIPVAQALRATMDGKPRTCPTILATTRGAPWTADGFRSSWGKACKAAGIKGLSFHDLPDTTVTRLKRIAANRIQDSAFG
jgi:integrase